MLQFTAVEIQKERYLLEMPHCLYYEFAKRSFILWQNLAPLNRKAIDKNLPKKKADRDTIMYEHRLSMNNIVIFGALSLEAYINYYAIRYEIPYYNDLDRSLSTLNKFKIYTQLKTKKALHAAALKKLKEIFDLRDEIVHPKAEKAKMGSAEPPKGMSAQAKLEKLDKAQFIMDLNSVFMAVFKIDKDEDEAHARGPWLCELKKRS